MRSTTAGLAAALGGLALLVTPAPASATWDEVLVTEDIPATNPCTGLFTTVHLSAEQIHVTGGVSGNEGIHWRGTYVADDGAAGRFRDTDQVNDVAAGDGFVVSQRVVFSGTYEGRHQRSTYIAHATVTGGVERVFLEHVSASCSLR